MVKKVAIGLGSIGAVACSYAKAYALTWTDFFSPSYKNVGRGNLPNLVQTIINVALLAAGVVAVVFLIIGGYRYITSQGNAEQATAAKSTILNAIIGLVIIFAAYLIVNFIMKKIIGFNPTV